MKKVISLFSMCLMALAFCALVGCSKDKNEANGNGGSAGTNNGGATGEYVDLGLTSGTKWKASNEVNEADAEYDFFTYDEAMDRFGNSLPTKEQCEELIDECQWSWTGSGYDVTGPNGNSIFLPAKSYRDCDGGVADVNGTDIGDYWSSTLYSESTDNAILLHSVSEGVGMVHFPRCFGLSVRLVQK